MGDPYRFGGPAREVRRAGGRGGAGAGAEARGGGGAQRAGVAGAPDARREEAAVLRRLGAVARTGTSRLPVLAAHTTLAARRYALLYRHCGHRQPVVCGH